MDAKTKAVSLGGRGGNRISKETEKGTFFFLFSFFPTCKVIYLFIFISI